MVKCLEKERKLPNSFSVISRNYILRGRYIARDIRNLNSTLFVPADNNLKIILPLNYRVRRHVCDPAAYLCFQLTFDGNTNAAMITTMFVFTICVRIVSRFADGLDLGTGPGGYAIVGDIRKNVWPTDNKTENKGN